MLRGSAQNPDAFFQAREAINPYYAVAADHVQAAMDLFAKVAQRANRTFWLNPEPRLYWNYGDSVMSSYEPFCDGAFECWQTEHLENFVDIVATGRVDLRTGPAQTSRHRY